MWFPGSNDRRGFSFARLNKNDVLCQSPGLISEWRNIMCVRHSDARSWALTGDAPHYMFVMEYRYIKGVMDGPSGKTMRVDFNPFKTCSFNCVYCVLGLTTEMTTERREFYPVGEVFAEIRRHIEENGKPDAILLTGSGEPALYSGFGDLAMRIKEAYHKPDINPAASPIMYLSLISWKRSWGWMTRITPIIDTIRAKSVWVVMCSFNMCGERMVT